LHKHVGIVEGVYERELLGLSRLCECSSASVKLPSSTTDRPGAHALALGAAGMTTTARQRSRGRERHAMRDDAARPAGALPVTPEAMLL
jgi:hypothetical protein